MFSEQLKKILQLSKQTGDRVVIFDSANPDDSYVISHLNHYLSDAKKVTLDSNQNEYKSNNDLTKEINSNQSTPHNLPLAEKKADFSQKIAETENLTEEDLTDKINREISMWKNQASAEALAEEDKVKKSWQIPPAVKEKAHNIE